MSLDKIHLRKLLKILYLPDGKRRSELRADIRNEIGKPDRDGDGGGDFHVPFWAAAKQHVAGAVDLRTEVKTLVKINKRRSRLYPALADGFLRWWNENRRWQNEPFAMLDESVHGRLDITELNAIVKVENLLALRVGEHSERIIYPYFSEEPLLGDEAARLGLWVLVETLRDHRAEDMRMLDVLRGASFGVSDVPFQGNEEKLLLQKYGAALDEWEKLKDEYQ